MPKLLLIDTFNFLHRAYHALPNTFKDQNGEPTNAVYGVTSMLINVLDQIKPTHAIAAVDTAEATFRIEDFSGYKAHRKPMESDLASQIPKVLEMIQAFGIKDIGLAGYEADDVIATSVTKFKDQVEIVVVSNDRDLWQLADNGVFIMLPNTKGSSEWIGPKEVQARLGFDPSKIADYKGLKGDPSDNIPGVFGVGDKTAVELITKYGSVEEIYRNIDTMPEGSLKTKLLNSYEQALMSKKLAQLIYDVPFTLDLSQCKYSDFNKLEVKKLLEKYNFKSLIRRLGFEDTTERKSSKKETNSTGQLSLL